MPRIKNWTKNSSAELWDRWRANFDSDEEAIVTAIWIGNRLVKDKAKSTRRKFYSLKDKWLALNQDNLVEGRIARMETSPCYDCEGSGVGQQDDCPVCGGCGEHWSGDTCWTCDGDGEINLDGECSRCGGTGIYRSWNLYEHSLLVAGRRYTFHGYLRPAHVSDEPGADCETYGGRFSEDELKDLALPLSGILKVLAHIATSRWGMRFSKQKGRYV